MRKRRGDGTGEGITAVMTSHSGPGREVGRLARLFTPGARLGWTFLDRRQLIAPYPEREPDPETISKQAARRATAAEKSYQRARRWAARPSLMLSVALLALTGFAKAINPATHLAGAILVAILLSVPGLAWTRWRWYQHARAKTADPDQLYTQARQDWKERAAEHQQAGLASVAHLPEWGSAEPPARRTDIFGGTLAGWQSLLTVHGASILAERPLLVADLSGQLPSGQLAGLARQAGVPTAAYLLPRDLERSGLLTRLTSDQFTDALIEAIHAGSPATRADRAVDVRILEQLTAVIDQRGATPARLAAAVQSALGHPVPLGLLAEEEAGLIQSSFPESTRPQVTANLIRLDAFLSGLAQYAGTGPPGPPPPAAYCTCLAIQADARSARAEMLTALVIQWLTVQVIGSTATTPAVIVAAADEISRPHAERLADACEQRQVPLTLLFRHLRDDAALGMIGGGTTAFMRLGNHTEAEQAATFIGRHHKFVLSGYTATRGGSQSRTRTAGESWGTGQSRSRSSTRGWSEDHLGARTASGGRTRSREYSTSMSWSTGLSEEENVNWSEATSTERVYEYAVEPTVLQHLPDHALLLATHDSGTPPQPVECDPEIITLPGVATRPFGSLPAGYPAAHGSRPQIAHRHSQPQWPLNTTADNQPAWRRPPSAND